MDALALTLGSIFASWFLLTCLNQFDILWLWRNVNSRDVFRLIPRWTFFAPNPGIYDYYVVARRRAGEAADWSDWLQVEQYTGRKWWHVVVNPDRRLYKIYIDIVISISRDAQRVDDFAEIMPLQLPYICVAHKVRSVVAQSEHSTKSSQYQFAIVRTHGVGQNRIPEVFFLSLVHGL